MTLSKLFDWYEEDFEVWPLTPGGRPPGDVLTWVFEFLSADRKAQLKATCGPQMAECTVDHFDYDWSLNSGR